VVAGACAYQADMGQEALAISATLKITPIARIVCGRLRVVVNHGGLTGFGQSRVPRSHPPRFSIGSAGWLNLAGRSHDVRHC
jgi:hypothetical protein